MKKAMANLSVQDILDRKCCREYREHPERLYAIWDGAQTLSARQMLAKSQVPLGDRVWAIKHAEPGVDWSAVTDQLYALVDAEQYAAAEGETNLRGKFGPDAWTAAYHVEAYAAQLGNSAPVAHATNLIREVLP